MYTFEPKRDAAWKPYIGDPFDISLDPVRMTQMAAGALTFLRADVKPARQTVTRTYSPEQVAASRKLPRTEWPYFTPGFPASTPLRHASRIGSFDGPPTGTFAGSDSMPFVSDTKELAWLGAEKNTGLVTVDAERTQALIGFVKANGKAVKHLSAEIDNDFATLVLVSLDDAPVARAGRLLLSATSRATNTGFTWNPERTAALERGGSPTLIEPVHGRDRPSRPGRRRRRDGGRTGRFGRADRRADRRDEDRRRVAVGPRHAGDDLVRRDRAAALGAA